MLEEFNNIVDNLLLKLDLLETIIREQYGK
jgi:hypothetical protein